MLDNSYIMSIQCQYNAALFRVVGYIGEDGWFEGSAEVIDQCCVDLHVKFSDCEREVVSSDDDFLARILCQTHIFSKSSGQIFDEETIILMVSCLVK